MTWLEQAERAALAYARQDFLSWYNPRPSFAALRKGIRATLAALPPFEDFASPAATRLLAQMQAQPPHVSKDSLFADLAHVRTILERIDAATAPANGLRDDAGEMFVCFAADAWINFTGRLPSDSTGSRFLKLLRENPPAVNGKPLKITRELLKDVLPRWLEYRGE